MAAKASKSFLSVGICQTHIVKEKFKSEGGKIEGSLSCTLSDDLLVSSVSKVD